jgi:puromycin-sensitive aminopeptidase
MPETKPFERLPTSVVPKHYNLKLQPDLKTFVFVGEVAIKVKVSYWMLSCMDWNYIGTV